MLLHLKYNEGYTLSAFVVYLLEVAHSYDICNIFCLLSIVDNIDRNK